MSEPMEHTAEQDAAIDALLPLVPSLGWTRPALRAALAASGGHSDDAAFLFPGGAAELVEAFCDLTDRRMEAAAAEMTETKLSRRVRALLAWRLAHNRPHKQAIARALAVLARPGNGGAARRCTARTIDAIWHAAGDVSADFAWYTKRASLAAVYAATLLFWLRDDSEADEATLAFLDRRLAGLGRIGKLRARLSGLLPGRASPAGETPRMDVPVEDAPEGDLQAAV